MFADGVAVDLDSWMLARRAASLSFVAVEAPVTVPARLSVVAGAFGMSCPVAAASGSPMTLRRAKLLVF